MRLPVRRLPANDALPQLVVDLLVDEYEGQHGSGEAPLVGAVFKEHDLEQRGQQRRKELRQLPQVLRHCLRDIFMILGIDVDLYTVCYSAGAK